jgi:mannose-6-phosphate isomerase-like protein (cupin superfamily)
MNTFQLGAGASVTILVRAAETAEQCSAILGVAEPGVAGPPPHRHQFTELYLVHEGRLEVRRNDELLELGSGDLAVIPPGAAHSFRVTGETTAKWVNVWAPGGFEAYFEEAALSLPADGPPDPAALAAIAQRYGLEPVGEAETSLSER